ncbi:MAG TPA: SMI1/KNR4 family protein [Planctomycetaceae bacterium]|nr:SMI1/KNR4 family protein [Planctomycetaceae bacterium]
MWREINLDLTAHATFAPSASAAAINDAETVLSISFPDELRSILQESNGVTGKYELGLVWNLDRMQRDNLQFRSDSNFRDLYMPFDHLLFFTDAGNGDQFAFPIQNGKIQRTDVFVWDHESDDRRWVAGSLKQYLRWWLDGTLTL